MQRAVRQTEVRPKPWQCSPILVNSQLIKDCRLTLAKLVVSKEELFLIIFPSRSGIFLHVVVIV